MFSIRGQKLDSYQKFSSDPVVNIDTKAIKKILKKTQKKSNTHRELCDDILKVLKGKKSVDDTDKHGNTVLMRIVNRFNHHNVEILLQNLIPLSLDLNIKNSLGTYLFLHISTNFDQTFMDTMILHNVAERTDPNITNGIGATPLISAIINYKKHMDMDLVDYLMDQSDLNAVTLLGNSALSQAITHFNDHKSIDLINRLVESTDFKKIGKRKVLSSALTRISQHGTDEIAKLVINKCEESQIMVTVLLEAFALIARSANTADNGPVEKKEKIDRLVPFLILIAKRGKECKNILNFDVVDKHKSTMMNYACSIGAGRAIYRLIKLGVDCNSRNGELIPLESAVMSNQSDSVRRLLKKGADPQLHKQKLPPLYYAVVDFTQTIPRFGSIKIIQRLLDGGANPNIKVGIGQILIPIILFCVMRPDWFDVAKRLVAAGLDLSENHTGWTGLRFLLIRQSLSYERREVQFTEYESLYPNMNNLINSVCERIQPKDFADSFLTYKVDTSVPMLTNGDTIMHYLVKMIIKGQLLPSCILNLKGYDSYLDIETKNDNLQTPIDLIDEAVINGYMAADVGRRLKRELI